MHYLGTYIRHFERIYLILFIWQAVGSQVDKMLASNACRVQAQLK